MVPWWGLCGGILVPCACRLERDTLPHISSITHTWSVNHDVNKYAYYPMVLPERQRPLTYAPMQRGTHSHGKVSSCPQPHTHAHAKHWPQVDAVLERVVAIDERTVALADLPQQLQEGLAEIGKKIQGLSSLVMEVGVTGYTLWGDSGCGVVFFLLS